ncbi:MAG: RNA polymerase-binding protein DksA [Legionellales bacterium]|nr:RNA polymerase-binding protein DksA [Legionellales bacterium]
MKKGKSPLKNETQAHDEKVNNVTNLSTSARGSAVGPIDFDPYPLQDGEEYMNEAQLLHFQNILRRWKQELLEEVDRTVLHLKDDAANYPDPNDRATQEEEFSLELRTRDRERKLIKKIDETLGLIEREEYGYCEMCGVEIGIRRLEARPTATLCIDCKTLEEIREKQLAS